jgi:hypothetical protein
MDLAMPHSGWDTLYIQTKICSKSATTAPVQWGNMMGYVRTFHSFPDPHFKKRTANWCIFSPQLMFECVFVMRYGSGDRRASTVLKAAGGWLSTLR